MHFVRIKNVPGSRPLQNRQNLIEIDPICEPVLISTVLYFAQFEKTVQNDEMYERGRDRKMAMRSTYIEPFLTGMVPLKNRFTALSTIAIQVPAGFMATWVLKPLTLSRS